MQYAKPILVGVVLTILLGLYGWAYLHLVERRVSFDSPYATAEYRIAGPVVKGAFLPAHAVDRLIRPRYWMVGGRAADPYDFQTFTR